MYNHLIKPSELKNIRVITLQQGQSIFREGDPSGGTMFFILDGVLGVYKNRRGQPVKLKDALKGEFFGELGLISNNPRLATLTAESPTARVALISRTSFVDTMDISPVFLFQVFKHTLFQTMLARKKLRKTLDALSAVDPASLDFRINFTRTFDVSDVVKNTNLDCRIYNEGEFLYRTGEEIAKQAILFVDYGQVKASYRYGKSELQIADLRAGTFFGEESLLEEIDTGLIPSKQAVVTTRVISFEKTLFLHIIKVRPDFLYDILSETIRKLSATENMISRLIDGQP